MWTRLLGTFFAMMAVLLFLRMPNLDSMILAFAALMVIAIFSEEVWEKFRNWRVGPGPHCPECGYDVRATPVRCPECGRILEQSAKYAGFLPKT